MRFGPVPIGDAEGKLLAHNIVDKDGRKRFSKGHLITPADVNTLLDLELSSVVTATLDATDVGENEAARRVATAIAGQGVRITTPGVGRANLLAEIRGPLYINVPLLERLNNIDEGITIATLREYTLVRPGQLLALVKIIPFGIPGARVLDVEAITQAMSSVVSVHPLQPRSVALIISGPESARERLVDDFCTPVNNRIQALGSTLDKVIYVSHTTEAVTKALYEQHQAGCDLIISVGISAIIDRQDVVPSALLEAGGTITHFGVPVDPGSLLMLGYIGATPVVGAPGCIRSPKTNVIDWILPRLLAGERLTHADLVVMGHGGLLDDISERPMPRSESID